MLSLTKVMRMRTTVPYDLHYKNAARQTTHTHTHINKHNPARRATTVLYSTIVKLFQTTP